jgi:predicted secreted protein
MRQDNTSLQLLQILMDRANQDAAARLRLREWKNKVIRWDVEGDTFYWEIDRGRIHLSGPKETDFILRGTRDALELLALKQSPLFLALWASGRIQFDGAFADAFRLGYVFLGDKRSRRVVFLAHCFLNMNTRFPEGADFEGAHTPLVDLLLKSGVGIVQMPCPEFQCLGLEKSAWGAFPEKEMRGCFRKVAEGVVDQIERYLELGYEIPGIIGMNPSPSCGVEESKGKETMLGLSRDTSEKKEPGVFIEELQDLLRVRGIEPPPVFGIRRTLPGETVLDQRIREVERRIRRPEKDQTPA